jgi:hypothetical protein
MSHGSFATTDGFELVREGTHLIAQTGVLTLNVLEALLPVVLSLLRAVGSTRSAVG